MAAPPLSEPGVRAFAVLSGLRAAASAGFDPHMPPQTCLIGASGPMLDFDRENGLPPADSEALDALWLLRWLPNTGNTALARFLDIHGEGLVLGTACASALQAIGEGFRRVRYGLSETVLCSGGIPAFPAAGCSGMPKPTRSAGTPCHRKRPDPFDEARDGFVPGEGGAAFVLESLESARARGAAVFAELLGFGASLDGGALTAPDESARFAEQAVRGALADAGLEPHAVDWVSAHGTGTPLNDRSEAVLLERVFAQAEARPAVTALQVMDRAWLRRLRGDGAGLDALRMAIRAIAAHPEPARTLFRAVGLCRCNASVSRPGGGIGKFWIRRAKRGLGSTVRR